MTRRVEPPRSLSALLGAGLAGLRGRHTLRQDDIATEARHAGLPWDRVTVAAIELGRRQISATELLVLDLIVQGVTRERERIWDLVDPKSDVSVGEDVKMSGRHVRFLLGEANPSAEWPMLDINDSRPTATERKAADRLGTSAQEVRAHALRLWEQQLDAERDSRLGETAGWTPRTLQARRGHVTRQLIGELEQSMRSKKGKP